MRLIQHAAWWVFAILSFGQAALGQGCPASGLTLTMTGGRLGDPYMVSLSGTPGVSGLFGYDLSAGPVTVPPVGTICLGLTPALQVIPFALGPAGNAEFGGVLPP